MLTARYFNAAGDAGDAWELPQEIFDGVVHEAALHQVVNAHLANRRQGTAATKTRGMISGGGRKAWRQKGTGRARQGSTRAPHWRGGGVVFGPSPRSYRQGLPKKVNAVARRSAFNAKALTERLAVIERLEIDAPKTRRVTDLLGKIAMGERKLLVLTDGYKPMVYLSSRNLAEVQVMPFHQASAYDVMRAHEVLVEAGALQTASKAEAPAREVVHA
ncbi:MAG: 50S ribosomal protein L4 [Gemmatimonadota bacterium]|jgi:large subunit ribosomal protein L4|nr:50S ribosomal protein L4 [Gemmatimonadota bacterium]